MTEKSEFFLRDAVQLVKQFSRDNLSWRISDLESELVGSSSSHVEPILQKQYINSDLLSAAYAIKEASAQIDVVIHAIGILYCLPEILEDGEIVKGLSLGAGQGQGDFDLETSVRVAEFKFIKWQKSGNALRKKTLFEDYVKLALIDIDKSKFIYLLDAQVALKFLRGKSKPTRLLNRNK